MDDHPTPIKFTIATVTYNAASVLERTLRSVAEQDYPYIEHLIIDGNSQDETLELFHHYQERNSTAAVRHELAALSEPDEGLYDAMNKALQMATGDYILFLNAGDRLHASDTLSRIAVGINGNRPAVIYGLTDIVDNEGRFLRKRRLAPSSRLTWRSFKYGMLVCHQAFMVRMDLARLHPYDLRYRFSADFDWCIRIMKEAGKQTLPLQNAGLVMADYLDEGLTTRNHRASLLERFRIMCRYYGWFTTCLLHCWFVVRSIVHK